MNSKKRRIRKSTLFQEKLWRLVFPIYLKVPPDKKKKINSIQICYQIHVLQSLLMSTSEGNPTRPPLAILPPFNNYQSPIPFLNLISLPLSLKSKDLFVSSYFFRESTLEPQKKPSTVRHELPTGLARANNPRPILIRQRNTHYPRSVYQAPTGQAGNKHRRRK